MSEPLVLTRDLGGGALTRAALAGTAPAGWYAPLPRSVTEWSAHVSAVRDEFTRAPWLQTLEPAIASAGRAAARLARSAGGRGVIVTTGQQPGLFGGPVYTWSKALSALALADAIEAATGVPAAPLFWAATDDADFVEASATIVARAGGVSVLTLPAPEGQHAMMAAQPLGDVSALLRELEAGAGSVVDPTALDIARRAYAPDATIGGAYLALLRAMLEPLGIAVLDAAHPAVRTAAWQVTSAALRQCEDVAAGIQSRDRDITAAGFTPQVSDVEQLTLVFEVAGGGGKRRIARREAETVLGRLRPGELSPNVLLRPVVERAIVPTVAYLGGPAEVAYFAQVNAVADAVGARRPVVAPRWSGTIVEPHVSRILERYDVSPDDLKDPHGPETRLAAAAMDPRVRASLDRMRADVDRGTNELRSLDATVLGAPEGVVEGSRRALHHRIDRLERRLVAAAKRREVQMTRDLATARGALYPLGKPQERALNLLPLLARHGTRLLHSMLEACRVHARVLLSPGTPSVPAGDGRGGVPDDAAPSAATRGG